MQSAPQRDNALGGAGITVAGLSLLLRSSIFERFKRRVECCAVVDLFEC